MKNAMQKQIFTIGHSNLPLEQFLALLRSTGSRPWWTSGDSQVLESIPHFNEKNLAAALEEAGIEYRWMEALGGRRPKRKDFVSPNGGLENESFRNYADYMSPKSSGRRWRSCWQLPVGRGRRSCAPRACTGAATAGWSAISCSANGVAVQHIFPSGDLRPHQPTPGAKFGAGRVTYPAEQKSLFE